MKPTDLERFGRLLYGDEWKRPLARALDVAERKMYRWMAGEAQIPETVMDDLQRLAEASGKASEAARRILGPEFEARVFRD